MKTPPEACGLYIHTPFCETKCGYCDFFSVPLGEQATHPLVERLCSELRRRVRESDLRVATVFVGGGTPTVLQVEQLGNLMAAIAEVVSVDELDEFTVEANPATVDSDKAQLLKRSGVTRVSMGAQSFIPAELAALERLHTPDDIGPSVETLRLAGIGQINIDLIFGIPGQTLATWQQSLRRAIDLGVDHLACYGLTYEPKTRLTRQRDRGTVIPCDEEVEADMHLATIDLLTSVGYEQYEISNYAKPNCQSRHNLMYWQNAPYIGVGPSAAGCHHGRRYKNVADVNRYIRWIDERGQAEAESETIDTETLMIEMVLMQLRTMRGLSIGLFQERTGVDPRELFADPLSRLTTQGLVAVTPTHIALTRNGQLLANYVMRELAVACNEPAKAEC